MRGNTALVPGARVQHVFADLLRDCRELAGLTQRELATRSGISVSTIRDLEQGRSARPRSASVNALMVALRLPDQHKAEFRQAALSKGDSPVPGLVERRLADWARQVSRFAIGVLGPLVMYHGDRPVRLGVGHHRTVLGRLALSANSAVPRDDLIRLLWSDHLPPTAVNTVQQYVTRLRRAMEPQRPHRGSSESLVLLPGGYQLTLSPPQLDLVEYRDLVTRAGEIIDDGPVALAMLGRALDLWRGDVLADVPDLHQHPLVVALNEERVALTIRYADLAGARSWQEKALPRLHDLAARHPLHEPLHSRLITTLGALGRQSDAFRTYATIRDRLAEELGIDPGPELVEAHRAVLSQRWTVGIAKPIERTGGDLHSAYECRGIGLLNAESGRHTEAEEAYERALAHCHPSEEFTELRVAVLTDLGTLHHECGRFEQAAACFTEVLHLHSGSPLQRPSAAQHRNLARSLLRLSRLTTAQHHLELALEAYHREGSRAGELSVLDELSNLHMRKGRHEAATAAARQARALALPSGSGRSDTYGSTFNEKLRRGWQ